MNENWLFREHNEMVVVGDPSDQNPFGGRLKDQRLMMWSFEVMRRFKRIKENLRPPGAVTVSFGQAPIAIFLTRSASVGLSLQRITSPYSLLSLITALLEGLSRTGNEAKPYFSNVRRFAVNLFPAAPTNGYWNWNSNPNLGERPCHANSPSHSLWQRLRQSPLPVLPPAQPTPGALVATSVAVILAVGTLVVPISAADTPAAPILVVAVWVAAARWADAAAAWVAVTR